MGTDFFVKNFYSFNKIESLIFYMIFLHISFFLYKLCRVSKGNVKFFLKGLAFIIPVIISGIRYKVGTDYSNYVLYMYLPLREIPVAMFTTKEIGFEILVKIAVLFKNYKIIFFLASLLTNFLIFSIISSNKVKYCYIGYLVYLYIMFPVSLTLVRQYIAIAFSIYAFRYLVSQDSKKYYVTILIGSLFHKTVLIMTPFYWICNNFILKREKKYNIIKIRKKRMIIILVFILICVKFYKFFIKLFSNINEFERYKMYLTISAEGNNKEFYIKILLFLILGFIGYFYRKNQKNKEYIYIYQAVDN